MQVDSHEHVSVIENADLYGDSNAFAQQKMKIDESSEPDEYVAAKQKIKFPVLRKTIKSSLASRTGQRSDSDSGARDRN